MERWMEGGEGRVKFENAEQIHYFCRLELEELITHFKLSAQ
jgi:hypothetical protein